MPKFSIKKVQIATVGSITKTLIMRRMHPCSKYPDCELAFCNYAKCPGFTIMTAEEIMEELVVLVKHINKGDQ